MPAGDRALVAVVPEVMREALVPAPLVLLPLLRCPRGCPAGTHRHPRLWAAQLWSSQRPCRMLRAASLRICWSSREGCQCSKMFKTNCSSELFQCDVHCGGA